MPALGFLDLCDEARAAVARGDLAKGRRFFERALEIKPDSAEATYGLATVCYLLKDLGSAKELFQQVQKLDPLHAGAAINLGALSNLEAKYEEAITYLRRGIQLDRTRCEGYYNLGIAYKKLGKFELAIQAYREAHHLNPRMAEAVFNLANIYLEMERFDQAISHYRQAVEINPGFRKARECLTSLERKLREARKQETASDEIPETDTPIEDPLESDPRLDRVLDPEFDEEALNALHVETREAEKTALEWLKRTEELDSAVRNLSIHLTTDSDGLNHALKSLNETLLKYQKVSDKFEDHCQTISRHRVKLAEKE